MDNHLWAYSPLAGLLWRMPLPAPLTLAPKALPDGQLLLTMDGVGVWRVQGRKVLEKLPLASATSPNVASPTSAGPNEPLCHVPLLHGPLAGTLDLGEVRLIWSQQGEVAAISPKIWAAACR
jgi:hypothetical protein